MHTALRAGAGPALLAASGVLVGAAVFFGGGSGQDSVLPLGGAILLVLAVAMVFAALGRMSVPKPSRAGSALLGLLLGLLAWTGASIAWSVAPDLSWDAFDKQLVALCFLALGLLAARGPRAARAAGALLALVLGAALVWALAGKAIPALFPDGARVARLRDPVGYWNGLALLADFALPLALWLGSRASHTRAVRVAGALLVYVSVIAILLSGSRTGLAAGAAAIAIWVALARERVEGALLLLAGAVPAAAVSGWAFTRPGLVDDGQSHADRVHDGAAFAAFALAGAVLVGALVVIGLRRGLRRRRETGRALAALAVLAAVAGFLGLVLAVGNPASWAADQFSSENASVSGPERFFDPSSNNRWQWWNEAWDIYRADELAGSGAGTFEVARKRYREDALSVTEPHNVPLQVLSGTGLVGFALYAGAVAAAVATAVGALRRLGGGEHAAAVALVVVPAAYFLHSLADYDLDFLATTGLAAFALGVLGAAGRPEATGRRPLWGIAAVAMAVVAIGSLASPRLAENEVEDALAALERGDYEAAVDHTESARDLDPFALDPIFTRAQLESARGNRREARQAYFDAVRLQPDNPEPWLELGRFEFALGRLCSAYRYLNQAYTLDPAGREWSKGGELDRARAHVNSGACSR